MHKFIFAHNSEKGRSKRKWPNETLSNDFVSRPKHPLPRPPPNKRHSGYACLFVFFSTTQRGHYLLTNKWNAQSHILSIYSHTDTHTSTLYTSFVSLHLIFNNKDLFNTVYEYESESEWVYVSESVTMNVSG